MERKVTSEMEKETYKKIGQKIRDIRKKNNVSQRAIASYLGIAYQQYQKYEKGINKLSINTLSEVCNYFKCDLLDLIELKKEDKQENGTNFDKTLDKKEQPNSVYNHYIQNHTYKYDSFFVSLMKVFSSASKVKMEIITNKILFIVLFFGVLLTLSLGVVNLFEQNIISVEILLLFRYYILVLVVTTIVVVVFKVSIITYLYIYFIIETILCGLFMNVNYLINLVKMEQQYVEIIIHVVALILTLLIAPLIRNFKSRYR